MSRMPLGGRQRAGVLVLLLPVLFAGECNDGVIALDSVMQVEPRSLDFGDSPISQDSIKTVRISNPSALDLQIEIVLAEDSDPAFFLDDPPQLVPSGDHVDLDVRFRPQLPTQVTGRIILTSDSKQNPRAEVALIGVGVDRGVPDIAADPLPVDFGTRGLGEVARQDLRVRNQGVRDLILDAVTLDDDGGGAFVLVTTAPEGQVLRPGDELSLLVAFSAPRLGDFAGSMRLVSNDPDQPTLEVLLKGSGHETPVAMIRSLDPIDALQPQDAIRLDGSGSYSPTPDVSIVRYEWRLSVRPPGSTTVIEGELLRGVSVDQETPQVELLLDLAGRYEILLYVVDSRGLRSAQPAVLRLRAVPDEDLHIQLVWDHPTADLDLHFLRGRTGLFDHDTDCYFSNRFPDWYPADPDSNPRLDVDDQGGFGPENINVIRPGRSIYTILVHYWDARTNGDATTAAIVRVFVRGQVAGEFSHTFTQDERLWSAVELDWPAGLDEPVALTPLDTTQDYRRPF